MLTASDLGWKPTGIKAATVFGVVMRARALHPRLKPCYIGRNRQPVCAQRPVGKAIEEQDV
ncbi:MAG: hypothetical protein CL799_04195 [Chromatiales bacterium]|nr:hypothetical protein [Chromatiales bacterium]